MTTRPDLAALRRALPASPLTRFAPAPTGFLHLGHVVNAVYAWGLARALGGRVLLRIEDHDAERCRPEYERALLDDLDWLGFVADVHPTGAFRGAAACEARQSDRTAVYAAAAASLGARGLVYGCTCSRADVASASQTVVDGERRYPGTCRDRRVAPGEGVGWRLRIDGGEEGFVDALSGPQVQRPDEQCGDVLIRDRRGNWTYQFVAAVDDHRQGVDLVVRGFDLLPSTGRQIRIARLDGRARPATFAHHALVMKSPTQKLSKSDGDAGVRDLRAAGLSAADVIGRAAQAVGLIDAPASIGANDVETLFLPRAASVTLPTGA